MTNRGKKASYASGRLSGGGKFWSSFPWKQVAGEAPFAILVSPLFLLIEGPRREGSESPGAASAVPPSAPHVPGQLGCPRSWRAARDSGKVVSLAPRPTFLGSSESRLSGAAFRRGARAAAPGGSRTDVPAAGWWKQASKGWRAQRRSSVRAPWAPTEGTASVGGVGSGCLKQVTLWGSEPGGFRWWPRQAKGVSRVKFLQRTTSVLTAGLRWTAWAGVVGTEAWRGGPRRAGRRVLCPAGDAAGAPSLAGSLLGSPQRLGEVGEK